MQNNGRRLILASASPRRSELLARMGFTFDIIVPDADEHARGNVESVVIMLAYKKALAVKARADDGIIVAADTLVALDGEILGKPTDADDAKRILRKLSARTHDVYTGVCIMDARTGAHALKFDRSRVEFRALADKDIDDYIATGEPLDRAGAYAIQGGASDFVIRYSGSYENVMGFPTQMFEGMYADFISQIDGGA